MKISQNGVDFIKSYEGYHKRLPDGNCTTYYCPAGVLTIGYGSTNMDGGESFSPGAVWTPQQANDRLKDSLAKNYEPSVRQQLLAKGLEVTQAQYDMLVSFTYNCGSGSLAQLLRHDDIANALTMFVRGGGQVLPGLVRRRAQERGIYLYGYSPDMAQEVEQATPGELKQTIAKNSTKISLLRRGIAWFIGTVGAFFTADTFQLAIEATEKVKEIASANVIPILCIIGIVAFVVKNLLEQKAAQDAAQRGYVPSKMEEVNHVGEPAQ